MVSYNSSTTKNEFGSLLGRLKEGIAFEQSKGHQNWPGQNQIFSDFLNDTLGTIAEMHTDSSNQGVFADILKRAREYSSLTESTRARVLKEVTDVIERVNETLVEDVAGIDSGLLESEYGDVGGYVPLVIDLEATDLPVESSHVVEICVQHLLSGECFETRVRLPDNIVMHKDAERITGIRTEDVKGEEVPTFKEAMGLCMAFVERQCMNGGTPLLIGHNIWRYDIPLLKKRMADVGLTDCFQGFDLLDTLHMSQGFLKKETCSSYGLASVYHALVGEFPVNTHSARGDVLATGKIVERIYQGYLEQSGAEGSLESWGAFFKFLNSGNYIRREQVKESVKTSDTIACILSRDDLLNQAQGGAPLPEEDFEFWGTQDRSIFAELSTPIKSLDYFTSSEKRALTQMQCQTMYDVLYYLPKGYVRASVGVFPCRDTPFEQAIVLPVHCERLKVMRGKFHILHAEFRCLDHQCSRNETWRNPLLEYKVFRRGKSAQWAIAKEEERLKAMGDVFGIFAKVSRDDGTGNFVIKEKSLDLIPLDEFKKMQPSEEQLKSVYSQKGIITSQVVAELISKTLKKLRGVQHTMADPLPSEIRRRNNVQRYAQALEVIHHPQSMKHFAHARHSLAFYELFYMQLRLLWRSSPGKDASPKMPMDLTHQRMAIDTLAFPLTRDQIKALDDIQGSCSSKTSASIFLQGDVGCGKTIVALLSALMMTPNGTQVACMAPTEVLAEQHMKSLEHLVSNPALPQDFKAPTVALLTGSTKTSERRQILEKLAAGDIDILIGTHAIISAPVIFRNLGLAIIDEQHKFGVEQRAALLSKRNPAPHLLHMSATPIPRSLALVLYGEMDLIEIKEMPPGRIPVKTSVWVEDANTRQALIHEMKAEMDGGGKCFIICPLIDTENTEENGMRTVLGEKERLCSTKELDAATIGLLHGRMTSAEKDQILSDFANPRGSLKVLISTTVVEVGVNVPDATLMIVEHAERFGLAQLHQLRGRVGRGIKQSQCILVTNKSSSDRLRILEETNDGFRVAEADLSHRGAGDILGVAQAGQANTSSTHLWELPRDAELVSIAREEASSFLEEYGYQADQWPAYVSEALHHASNVDLDIHKLPNFTL